MKYFYTAITISAVSLMFIGCGGKDDAGIIPPPPPVTEAVTMNAAPPPAAAAAPDAPAAPGAAVPDGAAPAAIATTATAQPEDMFKGMTEKQIEDFKKSATPETHDMNLTPLSEAVYGFFQEYGRPPASQEQLVKAGHLPKVLPAPKGKKYVIDPKTLQVSTQNL